MVSCPYCNEPFALTYKYNFCTKCDKQIKCKACGEYLLPNKPFCFVCGEPLIEQKIQSVDQINRYYLQEERTTTSAKRKIELTLTDEAIGKALPLFGTQLPLTKATMQEPIELVKQTTFLPAPDQLEQDTSSEELKEEDFEESKPKVEETKDSNDASSYFHPDQQGHLISQFVDYKGKSKKQQQERFILLYAWASLQLKRQAIPSVQHMNEAAKSNGIFDVNFTGYFRKIAKKFLTKIDDTYKLSPTGQMQVTQILRDMQDETLQGHSYWEGTKARGKRAKTSKDDEAKLDGWVEMDSALSNIDVRQFKELELCIFALYDLTKVLQVQDSVKPGLAYEYLKKRYKTVSITKAQFSTILSREYNKDKFQRTSNGLYYLTPKAEGIAKSWLPSDS